jgi:hypothetical protein
MNTDPFILDETTKVGIVQRLIDRLRDCYVFPEVAELICTSLHKHQVDGEYSEITEGEFFALALTLHMQEVSHDEHVWVRWHPEGLPEYEGQLRLNQEWQEERQQEARLDNFGLHKVERLAGNVGYLDIHYFHRAAWGGDTTVAAMNFLANTNSMIIDLRKCTGGYPGMIALLSSFLFGEEPVHLVSIYWRDENITQQYWTLPYIPDNHYVNKPIYVLISKVTFSGGEMFAYILNTHQRAILIGEKTDGGAHAGASYGLHPHFEVFIPIGRTINPITGSNWEGKGVIPDIPVAEEHAFNIAYNMALKSILKDLGETPSGSLKVLAGEVATALKQIQGFPNNYS